MVTGQSVQCTSLGEKGLVHGQVNGRRVQDLNFKLRNGLVEMVSWNFGGGGGGNKVVSIGGDGGDVERGTGNKEKMQSLVVRLTHEQANIWQTGAIIEAPRKSSSST